MKIFRLGWMNGVLYVDSERYGLTPDGAPPMYLFIYTYYTITMKHSSILCEKVK